MLLTTIIHYQKERWSHRKSANMISPSYGDERKNMRDLLLLRNLLHVKQASYFGAERQGLGLQNIWGCQWQLLIFPDGFIVLQGQEGYLPSLILMEIASGLQVGLAENIFFFA